MKPASADPTPPPLTQWLTSLPVLSPSGGEDWQALCERLMPDLQATAEACGLFERFQTLVRACDLLRLLVGYALHDVSLREMSFWAGETLDLDVTDEALRVKFHRSLDWLALLLSRLLRPVEGDRLESPSARVRFCLIDATMLAFAGSKGAEWRLHLTYGHETACMEGLELTTVKSPEALHRCRAEAFDIPIGDRAYGLAKHYHHGVEQNLYPLVRVHVSNLRLADTNAQVMKPADLLQKAEHGEVDLDVLVLLEGKAQPGRLVWSAMPAEAAARARQALRQRAKKEGYAPSELGLALAGWVVLLTRLPREHFSAALVRRLYRQRWQIELFFKRCRQLLGLGVKKKLSPRLAQVVVLTKMLVVALLQRSQPMLFCRPAEGEERWLWRWTRVLLLSLTSVVFAVFSEGWQRWIGKLAERGRKRRRSEHDLPLFREAVEGWVASWPQPAAPGLP